MRIKPLLLLVLFLFSINTNFALSTSPLDCGQYGTGTISQNMCDLIHLFRNYLGASIMLLILFAAILYAIGQVFGAETRAKAILWSQNILITIFIATLIYFIFTEQNIASLLTGQFPGLYFKHIVVALSFGVIWVVLFYLPGQVLQHPPLQFAAKEELGVLIMSIVILMSWTTITQFFTDITTGIVAQSTSGLNVPTNIPATTQFSYITSHLDIAYGSLEIFFIKLRTQYTHLYLFEVLIGFLSTVSFPIGSPLPAINIISFSLMPFDGLVLLSNAHTVVVEAIGYLMSVIWAKQFIILFARDAVPTILLPFGIIMRAFPWYRSTGSSLIAICLVVYFVYPLTVMLSNYLVFDVFKPADFLFTPNEDTVSFYNDPSFSHLSDAQKKQKINDMQNEARNSSKDFLDQFKQDKDIIRGSGDATECSGNIVSHLLCSAWNKITFVWHLVTGFVGTVFNIWKTMVTFGGDWVSGILGLTVPTGGAASGLYRFIVEEVISISQMIIVITITSVIEIIITITMYRNISELIGGEVEIAGLTKII